MATGVPFGSWPSPIGTQMLTSAVRSFGALGATPAGIWWSEARPDEGGRNTLMWRDGGGTRELLAAAWSARSRVHEYGGGAVLRIDDGFVFTNFKDQQLHRLQAGAAPDVVTHEPGTRFADYTFDASRGRLIAVAERAAEAGEHEPENLLLAVDLARGATTPLLRGADFYAAPRLSSDGKRLAWLQWRHPHMPWDAAQLWVGECAADGSIVRPVAITRAAGESAFQPEWLADGRLVFMCDRSGFWNPWLWDGDQATQVVHEAAEYGLPLWGLGGRSYCVIDQHRLAAQRIVNGAAELVHIDLRTGRAEKLPSSWQRFAQLCSDGNRLWFIGERPDCAAAIVQYDLARGAEQVLEGGNRPVQTAFLATPERVSFAGDQGETTWAWFYPPHNEAVQPTAVSPRAGARTDAVTGTASPAGAAEAPASPAASPPPVSPPPVSPPPVSPPPLMLITHGGPTGATSPALNLRIQYFTSRGWAVVDVDYSGSTGYGRAYRERLRGRWGIADVNDVVAVVDRLAADGRIDPARVAIRGGSAGGYTTLAALAFSDRFRAGVSYYGIGDLAALARDTHKFESRYTDGLIAPWPEGEAVYRERSPIHHLDGFACPVIFLQGGEDRVVPPNQSEAMAAALRTRGIAVAHVLFPEEGHGFRNGSNVRRAMALEYSFLARVFGFTPADPAEPLQIDNLPEQQNE